MRLRAGFRHPATIGLLFAIGLAGSVWCYKQHVCMDGHMAHPQNIHAIDYTADTVWAGALVVASSLRFTEQRKFRWIAFLVLIFLFYRFVLGNLGGLFPVPI